MKTHEAADNREPRAKARSATSLLLAFTICALTAAGALVALHQVPARAALSVVATGSAPTVSDAQPVQPEPTETVATPSPTGTTAPPASATGYDITSLDSVTILVNKSTPLTDQNYEPDDLVRLTSIGVPSTNDHSLRREAAEAIRTMFQDAAKAGHDLDMTSGFRDRELQQQLYDQYVDDLGAEGANATSARPGYSEHQTGLAADISAEEQGCVLEACFGETEAGKWLAENSWKYGFILRYPEGETGVTGYEYEPWHFRYVGVDVATKYHESGATTYEDFLGVPAAPDYSR